MGKSLALAKRQLEECFCDFVGVYSFGTSFLHAFRYLVAPSLGNFRNVQYPAIGKRAEYMQCAAKQYGFHTIERFSDSFSEQRPQLSQQDEIIVKIADGVTEKLYRELLPLVQKMCSKWPQFNISEEDEGRMKSNLWNLVPADGTDSIASIVHAGWGIRLELDDWPILLNIQEDEKRRREKLRVLGDLILKSFEVFEYRRRLEKYATKRKATC